MKSVIEERDIYRTSIIHALISCRLDFRNSNLYNVRLQRLQNQCARFLTKSPAQGTYYPSFKKDRIIYTILMLTYTSYYNIAPSYLCELINKKESHVNTRLGTDH